MRIGLLVVSCAVLSLACGAPLERTGPIRASVDLVVSDGELGSAQVRLTHLGADCPAFAVGGSVNGSPLTELDSGGTMLTTTNLVSPETRCQPARYQTLFVEQAAPTRDEVVAFDFGSQGFGIESAKALAGRASVRSATVRRGEPLVVTLPPVPGLTSRQVAPPKVWLTDETRAPTPAEEASVSSNWDERPLDATMLSISTAGLAPGSWSLELEVVLQLAPERCDGFAECELRLERGEVITFVVTP